MQTSSDDMESVQRASNAGATDFRPQESIHDAGGARQVMVRASRLRISCVRAKRESAISPTTCSLRVDETGNDFCKS